jgi:hypothetical protein
VNSLKDIKTATERPGSFRQTLLAVLWSFFGVRRSANHEADMNRLNPVHVVVVGVLMAILFVTGLIGLVSIITS